MSLLKEHWNDAYPDALDYQNALKHRLLKDPTFLYKSTAEDIAGILGNFQKNLETSIELIKEIYRHTNLHNYHAYQSDELTKRIEFLKRVDADPVQSIARSNWVNPYFGDDERLSALKGLHRIQAEIYGFKEDAIQAVVRKIWFLNGIPCISNASHALDENIIYINMDKPDDHAPMIPSFRRNYADALTTVGHEGVHTKQTYFGTRLNEIDNAESRLVAEITYLNSMKGYYISVPFKDYKLNPCEQEAFDFENDLHAFLGATPVERIEILQKIESRRDAHLNHNSIEQRTTRYPAYNPAPAIAA